MTVETVIYDYVNDSGSNLIKSWTDSIGVSPTAKIDAILRNLENEPFQEWRKYPKLFKKLKGQDNLWEIRAFVDKVQWRPVGCLGPGQKAFTLLVGATEKGNKLLPASVLNTAQQRKLNVYNNTRGHRVRHVYRKTK